MNELTEKQRRFCEEYMRDSNGTQSAIRAGYSPHTANEQGARLLAKDSVQLYLERIRQATTVNVLVDVQRRKQILGAIAMDEKAYPRDRTAAIHELNLMEGSHAPSRFDVSDQRDQFAELMEAIRVKSPTTD